MIEFAVLGRASSAVQNGPVSLSNGNSSHRRDPPVAEDDVIPEPKDKNATVGMVPTQSAPTVASIVRVEQEKPVSSSINLPTTSSIAQVSDVYASASDPVLALPVSQNPAGVDSIVREVGSQRKAAEPNHIQGNKNVIHDVDTNIKTEKATVASTSDSIIKTKEENKLKGVEHNQPSDPLHCSPEAEREVKQQPVAPPKGTIVLFPSNPPFYLKVQARSLLPFLLDPLNFS